MRSHIIVRPLSRRNIRDAAMWMSKGGIVEYDAISENKNGPVISVVSPNNCAQETIAAMSMEMAKMNDAFRNVTVECCTASTKPPKPGDKRMRLGMWPNRMASKIGRYAATSSACTTYVTSICNHRKQKRLKPSNRLSQNSPLAQQHPDSLATPVTDTASRHNVPPSTQPSPHSTSN